MTTDDGKRRLPVIGKPDAGGPEEERPPWHWSAIGAVAIFLAWLPLATAATALSRGWLGEGSGDPPTPRAVAATVAVQALAFAIGCFGGGVLVGRFGGRAGVREATVAGFAAAAIAWAIGIASAGVTGAGGGATLVLLAVLGAGAARGGGALGKRTRAA